MLEVKAIVLPFFEFLAPYKPGQPLYLVPERAAVLCLAEVIIARDSDTGEELTVWGTAEYERLESGQPLQRGPVLVVELNFANELEDLIKVVTAVQGGTDLDEDAGELEDDEEEDEEEDEDEDEDENEEGDDEDVDDDLDDEWEEVSDDDDEEEEDAEGDDDAGADDDPA